MIFIQQGGNYHPLQVAQMIAHQLQQLEQLFLFNHSIYKIV